jgi:uncharacterized protein (DUF934 family)
MPLINSQQLVEQDSWVYVDEENLKQHLAQPGDIVIPFELWQLHQAELSNRQGRLGVRVDGSIEPELLVDLLSQVDLIALDFLSFTDGRGFSQALLLRQRYGYKGEIRAVGDVSWDRLRSMKRCGIDTFDIAEDRFDKAMFRAFTEISVPYQAVADGVRPIYYR